MEYIFDIVIVALLAFFAWRGASKGLILSLCGLVAVFVAFFAAQFVSTAFCAPVANIIRPAIVQAFRGVEPEPVPDPAVPEGQEGGGPAYTLDDLLDALQENQLFQGFSGFLSQGAAEDAAHAGAQPLLDALAGYLAKGIAKALLFALVFLGVQLGWFLISHALDLAFHLPILSGVNLTGGLLLGLVKGVLLVVVAVWLGQLSGVVPAEPDTPVLSLFTVEGLGKLLESLPG